MYIVKIASLRYRSGQAVAFYGVYAECSEVFRLLAMTSKLDLPSGGFAKGSLSIIPLLLLPEIILGRLPRSSSR